MDEQDFSERECQIRERYNLTIERIKSITQEDTVAPCFREFFQKTAGFILCVNGVKESKVNKSIESFSLEELAGENRMLYQDVAGSNYQTSYANPAYASSVLGEELGLLLCLLYTEIRGEIIYAYEDNLLYLTICNELFIEVYNCFEETEVPAYKQIRNIIYWYVSDYSDVFVADRIGAKLNTENTVVKMIVMNSDLSDLRYLYKYGEEISEQELQTAAYLNSLPETTIEKMAEFFVEESQKVLKDAGLDISQKKIINIKYALGTERILKSAIEMFERRGLRTTLIRDGVSILTKEDQGVDFSSIWDKKLVERKLDVMKNAYEQWKDDMEGYIGTVVLETMHTQNEPDVTLTEKQQKLLELYQGKAEQLVSHYTKSNKYLLREVKSIVVDIHKWD